MLALDVDYDSTNLPDGYDRARSHRPEVIALWLNHVGSYFNGRAVTSILDLGCGTGRYTAALAEHFDAEVLGIDPSRKMLDRARGKPHGPRVRFELAAAEAMPLVDASVSLVFASMVFHHLKDPARVASECRRVLEPGGVVFLRNGVRERSAEYPYVPFFPLSVPLLEQRLPALDFVRGVFRDAGFRGLGSGVLHQQVSPTLAAYADKLEAGGDSVLAALDPGDLAAGLSALRAHAARTDPVAVIEPVDYFAFG